MNSHQDGEPFVQDSCSRSATLLPCLWQIHRRTLPEAADQFPRATGSKSYRCPNLPYIETPRAGQSEPLLDAKPADGMLLINCWSTTCIPCLKELKEFTDHAQELHDANINVLALCLDAAETVIRRGVAFNNGALDLLKNMGYPF